MTPAGKTKEKDEAGAPEAQETPDLDSGPLTDEVPAVGESVTYVVWDQERQRYQEIASLITGVGTDYSVSLVAFFPHARAGRPVQHVPFRPSDYVDNPVTHWRYPEATVEDA